jgi:hypothetical protein
MPGKEAMQQKTEEQLKQMGLVVTTKSYTMTTKHTFMLDQLEQELGKSKSEILRDLIGKEYKSLIEKV